MTLKECYERFGGDYEDVFSRLRTEGRIEKFIVRFLDDDSYDRLCECLASNDAEGAFRAAHTLKGIAQNFSFTKLFLSAEEITEALRPGTGDPDADFEALLANVTSDYERVRKAIQTYIDEKQ